MRIRPTWLALGLAFVALSAQAQTASRPARPADADAFSVFFFFGSFKRHVDEFGAE